MKTVCEFELLRLERFRTRKVRRAWGRTLLALLTLLLLSALAGWLWSVVAQQAGTFNVERSTLNVRRAGVPEWLAWGLLCWLGLCVLGTWAWRCILPPAPDEEPGETIRDGLKPELRTVQAGELLSELQAMPEGLSRLDAALICFALAAETRLIREMVRSAQRSLSVDDYGDSLAGAERRLGDLRTRLWQLKAHFDGGQISDGDAEELPRSYAAIRNNPARAEAGTTNMNWPCVARREDAA